MDLFTTGDEDIRKKVETEMAKEIVNLFCPPKPQPDNPTQAAFKLYRTNHKESKDTIHRAVYLSGVNFQKYTTLITGPSGTGKELVAKILAATRQLHAINLAGLTDSLFESQLFGYVPGAFTGGISRGSPGFLRSASSGVAFLDEVGELPLSQQAKLLRAIEKREVLPVGGSESLPLECRFVFATNRDLLDMVNKGTFREDLYYRISQFVLRTYSLAERGQDEVQFIAHEIQKANNWKLLPLGYVIPPHITQRGNVRALYNWLLQVEYGVAPECEDIEKLEKETIS